MHDMSTGALEDQNRASDPLELEWLWATWCRWWALGLGSTRAPSTLNHRATFPAPNKCLKCDFTFSDIIFCLFKWLTTMPSTEGPMMKMMTVPCPPLSVSSPNTQRQPLLALLMFSCSKAREVYISRWVRDHFLLVGIWYYLPCFLLWWGGSPIPPSPWFQFTP